jgi:hypothetical protein
MPKKYRREIRRAGAPQEKLNRLIAEDLIRNEKLEDES